MSPLIIGIGIAALVVVILIVVVVIRNKQDLEEDLMEDVEADVEVMPDPLPTPAETCPPCPVCPKNEPIRVILEGALPLTAQNQTMMIDRDALRPRTMFTTSNPIPSLTIGRYKPVNT